MDSSDGEVDHDEIARTPIYYDLTTQTFWVSQDYGKTFVPHRCA